MAFREHRPDVTLMDLRMPKTNGLEATKLIRGEFPEARIVIMTTYQHDTQAIAALRAGAAGYLLKNMLRKELIEAIRAVHSGRRRMSAEIASEIAEYAMDDALERTRDRSTSMCGERQREQERRGSAWHHGGNSEGTHEIDTCQASCAGSHPRGGDRGQARHPGALRPTIVPNGMPVLTRYP